MLGSTDAWARHPRTQAFPLERYWADVNCSAIRSFAPEHVTGTVHRGQARNEMSKSPQAGTASGQVHLGVLQEEGQFLGHGVQFT